MIWIPHLVQFSFHKSWVPLLTVYAMCAFLQNVCVVLLCVLCQHVVVCCSRYCKVVLFALCQSDDGSRLCVQSVLCVLWQSDNRHTKLFKSHIRACAHSFLIINNPRILLRLILDICEYSLHHISLYDIFFLKLFSFILFFPGWGVGRGGHIGVIGM